MMKKYQNFKCHLQAWTSADSTVIPSAVATNKASEARLLRFNSNEIRSFDQGTKRMPVSVSSFVN